jgi:hypothetical protein
MTEADAEVDCALLFGLPEKKKKAQWWILLCPLASSSLSLSRPEKRHLPSSKQIIIP